MGDGMAVIIGICVAAAAAISMIITFCFGGAKVSKRADEWEQKYWRNK